MEIEIFTQIKSYQDLIEKLQHQVRLYKKQLEEAEDIASSNLAKYKVVQKVNFIDNIVCI